ncbi:UDP-N-acetylmuramoylalanine--D-glutamate ligase, partial [candidate division WOR-1 bacterium RIFCSPLOWO2_02_FULL_46_20]
MRGIRVLVLGFARSGIAAAKKLVSLGAKVILSEVKPESKVDSAMVKELRTLGVDLEFGGHTFSPVDLIVVSPEIHLDIPVLERARRKNIPIISEIELAYRLLKKPIIAVTGTNGKTTTTTLIGELLKAGGKKVAVAGNIGNPMVEVDDANLDYIVAEISSYQLETTVDFKPWISVILNIQPDHLERHKSMAEYIKQKAKIFANQSADDYLVYNLDEPQVAATVKSAKAKLVAFTKNRAEIIALRPAEIKIPGRHNLENALAAAQAAYLCGVDKNTVADGLKTFPGVEHRIEFVAKIKEVEYYNDSKATNPDSTLVALETFAGRGIVLILGGKDKGVPLAVLAKHVKAGVKEVVLLGEATQRFKKE